MRKLFFCVVFKWGSLVGISLPSEGINGFLPFVASYIVFRPSEYTGTITNDWTTVPYCTTNFGDYDNLATDHLSRVHIAANIKMGLGDICRYMGVVDGSRWRIPTAAEWAELYGSNQENGGQSMRLPSTGGWVIGNYYPLSGFGMGPKRNSVTIIGDGAAARVKNADPYNDGTVFLPVSGLRDYTNGAIWNIGSHGFYWSSTAATTSHGYNMQFSSSSITPQISNPPTYAFSVRCIRE